MHCVAHHSGNAMAADTCNAVQARVTKRGNVCPHTGAEKVCIDVVVSSVDALVTGTSAVPYNAEAEL